MPKCLYTDPNELRAPGKIHFEDIEVNQYNKTIEDEKANFSKEDFMRIYEDMFSIRTFELMLLDIKQKGMYAGVNYTYPGPAHLAIGQEAAAVGEAYYLDANDFVFGSHRSHHEIIAKAFSAIHKLSDDELKDIMENYMGGALYQKVSEKLPGADMKETAKNFFLYGAMAEIFAREVGFLRGLGGSMHAAFQPFGIYPNNAIVGGSSCIAAGAALYKKVNQKPGVAVANLGDGSLGCGPVWEGMNFAAMDQYRQLWEEPYNKGGLPVIFNFSTNSYGMGGKTTGETMGYNMIARFAAGVSPTQLHVERVDGFNVMAVIDAYRRKLPLAKEDGPVMLDIVTYRFSGHSPSDVNAYRSTEEIEAWQAQDAIPAFAKSLIEAGVCTQEEIDALEKKIIERNENAFKLAADKEETPYYDLDKNPHLIEDLMFSNQYVEKMDDRPAEMLTAREDNDRVKQLANRARYAYDENGKEIPKIKTYTIRDGLFEAMLDKFYTDPTLVMYGEDVAYWGGAFAVTRNMVDSVPRHRLFNSPISESAIVGTAVGYGMCGGRAIVELMYGDFLGRCGDEVFNQLAKWQAMSGGLLKMPVVLRISVGSKYGAQHSQEWTSMCAQVPGLKVVYPVTPYDAKGMMNTALAGTDPVVFFESQKIYDMPEKFVKEGVPEGYYEVPFGEPVVRRAGDDVTILTLGPALYSALDAAKTLEGYGVSAEVIDMRSVVPFNYEMVAKSVEKTGRVILVSEACERGSIMHDIASNLSQLCFDYLDAAPFVLGCKNWITPSAEYDKYFFVGASDIVDAIHEKLLPLPGHEPARTFRKAELIRKAKKGV